MSVDAKQFVLEEYADAYSLNLGKARPKWIVRTPNNFVTSPRNTESEAWEEAYQHILHRAMRIFES